MDISGIELIGDMTKDQIIDEIQVANRKLLEKAELAELKGMVIEVRMNAYRARLEREAKIEVHRSIFGSHVHETDED